MRKHHNEHGKEAIRRAEEVEALPVQVELAGGETILVVALDIDGQMFALAPKAGLGLGAEIIYAQTIADLGNRGMLIEEPVEEPVDEPEPVLCSGCQAHLYGDLVERGVCLACEPASDQS